MFTTTTFIVMKWNSFFYANHRWSFNRMKKQTHSNFRKRLTDCLNITQFRYFYHYLRYVRWRISIKTKSLLLKPNVNVLIRFYTNVLIHPLLTRKNCWRWNRFTYWKSLRVLDSLFLSNLDICNYYRSTFV